MIQIFGTATVSDLDNNVTVFNIAIPKGQGKKNEDVLGYVVEVTDLETLTLYMN